MKILNKYVKKSLVICIVIVFCFSSITSAYATYFSGTLINKSINNCVTVWQDSSVSSYGYGTYFTSGRNNWQSIDYSTLNFTVSSTDDAKYGKFYVGTTVTSGVFGYTNPKKKNLLGQIVVAGANEDWYHTVVTLYDNQIINYGLSGEREAIATHEVGHSIKMAHPSTVQTSIMNSPPSSAISAYDRQEFNAKW